MTRMSTKVDISAAERLLDSYGGDTAKRAIRRETKAEARMVVVESRRSTAFRDRTGILRRSFKVIQRPSWLGASVAIGAIGPKGQRYGYYLEYKKREAGGRAPVRKAVQALGGYEALGRRVADGLARELRLLGA